MTAHLPWLPRFLIALLHGLSQYGLLPIESFVGQH